MLKSFNRVLVWGMIIFGVRQSRSALAIIIVLAVSFLTACARKDGGAPIIWGSSYAAPSQTKVRSVKQARTQVIHVQRDDTLSALAQRYGVPTGELIKGNGLLPPYKIIAGQSLVVPEARAHKVVRGDTIYSLSRGYNLTAADIILRNRLTPPYTIKVGQQLLLPASAGAWPAEQIEERPVGGGTRVAQAESQLKQAVPAKKPASLLFGGIAVPTTKPRAAKLSTTTETLYTASIPTLAAHDDGFLWPVSGRVISNFGVKQNGLHNDGINIAVSKDAPVRAAQSGIVSYAGNELKGYGNLLLIKHADGYVTAYAHNNRLLVRRGDQVNQGEIIAEAGATGSVSSPQVHFEIRKGRNAINPNKHLSGA